MISTESACLRWEDSTAEGISGCDRSDAAVKGGGYPVRWYVLGEGSSRRIRAAHCVVRIKGGFPAA